MAPSMVRLFIFGLTASALILPVSTAEPMSSNEYSEYSQGGAVKGAFAELKEMLKMASQEVMAQIENIAWDDIIAAVTEAAKICKTHAVSYFNSSETVLRGAASSINWTYVEGEAEKALALSVEAKEVAVIFAQNTKDDGLKLTRKQVKFLTSEFLKLYSAINWTAIEEFLEVTAEVTMEQAKTAAVKSGEAAEAISAKTTEMASAAAQRSGLIKEDAEMPSAAYLVSAQAAAESTSSGVHPLMVVVPMALVVAAGVAWHARPRLAYTMAKTQGGEAAQNMI